MLITNAKIIDYLIIEVTTDEDKIYLIDFDTPELVWDHEFDKIRADRDHFYNDFNWDKYNFWWSPTEDVSIDELEYKSCCIKNG